MPTSFASIALPEVRFFKFFRCFSYFSAVETLMGEIVQSGSSSQASGGTGSSQKILDQISVLKEEHALQKSLLQIYIQDQGMIISVSI